MKRSGPNTIRQRRQQLTIPFSQHHLAQQNGIAQSTLSLIERDLWTPTLAQKQKIAAALRSTVAWLWPDDNTKGEGNG